MVLYPVYWGSSQKLHLKNPFDKREPLTYSELILGATAI